MADETFNSELNLDTTGWVAGLDAAAAATQGFGSLIDTISARLQQAMDLVIPHLEDAFDPTRAIKMAAAYDLATLKMGRDFGGMADSVADFGERYRVAFGVSEAATRTMTTATGQFFTELGFTRERTAQMSQGMLKLAADVAAMGGPTKTTEQALTALDSAMLGNLRQMKSFGIALSAQQVTQELISEGYRGQKKDLTSAQQAIAVYNTIVKETTRFQGLAAEQMNSFGGVMRQMKAAVDDAALAFGRRLEPAVLSAIKAMGGVGTMKELIADLSASVGNTVISWIGVFGRLGGVIISVWNELGRGPGIMARLNQVWIALEPLVHSVKNAMVSVGDYIQTTLSSATAAFGTQSKDVWQTIIKGLASIKPAVFDMISTLRAAWPQLVLDAKNAVYNITWWMNLGIQSYHAYMVLAGQGSVALTAAATAMQIATNDMAASVGRGQTAVITAQGQLATDSVESKRLWNEAATAAKKAFDEEIPKAVESTQGAIGDLTNDIFTTISELYVWTTAHSALFGGLTDSIGNFSTIYSHAMAENTSSTEDLGGTVQTITNHFDQMGGAAKGAHAAGTKGAHDMTEAEKDLADEISRVMGYEAGNRKQLEAIIPIYEEHIYALDQISRGYNYDTDGVSIWANVANQAYGTVQQRAELFLATIEAQTAAYDQQRAAMLALHTAAGISYGPGGANANPGGAIGASNPLGYSVFYGGGTHFADGGFVGGSSGRDRVPAMLTAGEFVVNPRAARANAPALQAMNSGRPGGSVQVTISLPGITNLTQAEVEGRIMPMIKRATRRGL